MEYMSVSEASEQWNVSKRWVQRLCEAGRIDGVRRFGRSWMIPKNVERPKDLRYKKNSQKDGGGT